MVPRYSILLWTLIWEPQRCDHRKNRRWYCVLGFCLCGTHGPLYLWSPAVWSGLSTLNIAVGYTMDTLYFAWLDSPAEVDTAVELPQFTLKDIIVLDCSQNYTAG